MEGEVEVHLVFIAPLTHLTHLTLSRLTHALASAHAPGTLPLESLAQLIDLEHEPV